MSRPTSSPSTAAQRGTGPGDAAADTAELLLWALRRSRRSAGRWARLHELMTRHHEADRRNSDAALLGQEAGS